MEQKTQLESFVKFHRSSRSVEIAAANASRAATKSPGLAEKAQREFPPPSAEFFEVASVPT
jgi:hypothetical protein